MMSTRLVVLTIRTFLRLRVSFSLEFQVINFTLHIQRKESKIYSTSLVVWLSIDFQNCPKFCIFIQTIHVLDLEGGKAENPSLKFVDYHILLQTQISADVSLIQIFTTTTTLPSKFLPLLLRSRPNFSIIPHLSLSFSHS